MAKEIQYFEAIEGNLKAEKCTGDFGGPNMWNLRIKNNNGWYEKVQWMDVSNIQKFFRTKLPVYNQESSPRYSLED